MPTGTDISNLIVHHEREFDYNSHPSSFCLFEASLRKPLSKIHVGLTGQRPMPCASLNTSEKCAYASSISTQVRLRFFSD